MSHINRLIGSYGALRGGTMGEALQDFTGGMLESLDLKKLSQQERGGLYDKLLKYQKRASLMGASVNVRFGVLGANLTSVILARISAQIALSKVLYSVLQVPLPDTITTFL